MHLEALQASFLSETNMYLGYTCHFGGHVGFGMNITHTHTPKKKKKTIIFNTRNWLIALKLVGLEVLLLSLCHIGQNLGIPQVQNAILAAILDLASRWPPNLI